MEEVSYELQHIEVLEFTMLPAKDIPEYESEEVKWHYSYSFGFLPVGDKKMWVTLTFAYRLYRIDDPTEQTIVSVKTESRYETQNKMSAPAKLALINIFLRQSANHLQGAYSAHTENTPVSHILPTSPPFANDTEHIKKQIYERWK